MLFILLVALSLLVLWLVANLGVTTPTSMVNRLMGLETWTDPVTAPVVPAQIVIAPATTTLTLTQALHAGRLIICAPTGGLAFTLPAPTGTGAIYYFLVSASVTGGSLTVDAKAGDASAVYYGNTFINKVGTGISTFGATSNSNLFTWNGTTTGGLTGDMLEIIDVATHVWTLWASGQGSGTLATPFSNH